MPSHAEQWDEQASESPSSELMRAVDLLTPDEVSQMVSPRTYALMYGPPPPPPGAVASPTHGVDLDFESFMLDALLGAATLDHTLAAPLAAPLAPPRVVCTSTQTMPRPDFWRGHRTIEGYVSGRPRFMEPLFPAQRRQFERSEMESAVLARLGNIRIHRPGTLRVKLYKNTRSKIFRL